MGTTRTCFVFAECKCFDSGVNTTTENEGVKALNEELNNGHLWGAALDVTNPEPLPAEHPLWENSRCIITPHASGVAFGHLKQTEALLCQLTCENIRRYRNQEKLRNQIF